jgi:hypothetical protein
VIVAEGFGLRLHVRNGMLVVEYAESPNGRRARLSRATLKGKRIVLLGRAGSVSVEALRWMGDVGLGFALIDAAAGRVVTCSAILGTAEPQLRRMQAAAPNSLNGIAVARFLIAQARRPVVPASRATTAHGGSCAQPRNCTGGR